jgi:hypothetical protein
MKTKSFRKQDDIISVRKSVLEMVYNLRGVLASMSDEELQNITINGKPFWHIINGPLADSLTHIGQINSFRRLAGNPTPKAKVFHGTPPENWKPC